MRKFAFFSSFLVWGYNSACFVFLEFITVSKFFLHFRWRIFLLSIIVDIKNLLRICRFKSRILGVHVWLGVARDFIYTALIRFPLLFYLRNFVLYVLWIIMVSNFLWKYLLGWFWSSRFFFSWFFIFLFLCSLFHTF